MRIAACLVSGFVWCASAAAQQAAVEDGLGPYRFGMSMDAARATSPNATWRTESVDGHQTLTNGRQAAIGEARLSTLLVFQQGQLERIMLLGAAPHACADVIPVVVEDLEQLYGALRSAPALSEQGILKTVRRTELGSEIRVRENEEAQEGMAFATQRREQMMLIVSGEQKLEEDPECRISVAFDRRLPEVAEAQRDLFDRIERAETAIVEWVERPQADHFDRYYPRRAMDRSISGIGVLDCLITPSGRVECRVAYESPAGEEFGSAALRIAEAFRTDVANGNDVRIGKRVRVPIRFRIF